MNRDDDRDPTDLGLSVLPDEPAPHRCTDGWVDVDDARPCLRCRPHLARIHRTGVGDVWTIRHNRPDGPNRPAA